MAAMTEECALVQMPEQADAGMLQAIEGYFSSRLKYKDGQDPDGMKADCWMALMAYYAMVAAVKARK